MSPRLKRFHAEVYFPPDWGESMNTFIESISRNPVVFSMHSVERIVNFSKKYGISIWQRISRTIKTGLGNSGNVFEFYSKDDGKIYKACFRYTYENFPVDIVLVVSSDGTVITVYVINKEDNHATLDKSLYERS